MNNEKLSVNLNYIQRQVSQEFHKNTIFTKNENLYALIEEHLIMSVLECDRVMVELDVKQSSKEIVVRL